jgi:hypothetical protein
MARHAKGVLFGAAVVMVAAIAGWLVQRAPSPSATAPAAGTPGGFLVAPAAPLTPNEPPAEEQVERVMKEWRDAILARNPDLVLACDRIFVGEPRLFTAALVKSAESDSVAQVRAFSTRVLGKFGDPTLVEVFRKQLADASPAVRENAAWSLGELHEKAIGLSGELEQARRKDQVEAVRRAAAEALEKVRGGARRAG